jgi:tRNA (guanine37-N1)-methyltransferase
VQNLVRSYCEDGKDFIRSVITRALDEPLPPAKPPISLTQQRKAVRERKVRDRSQSPSRQGRAAGPCADVLPPRNRITQFVMNLPDTAILFLGAFRGVLSPANAGGRDLSGVYTEMPMVHCYCFTREAEGDKAEVDIRQVSGEYDFRRDVHTDTTP